jgi:hypothetical protein
MTLLHGVTAFNDAGLCKEINEERDVLVMIALEVLPIAFKSILRELTE